MVYFSNRKWTLFQLLYTPNDTVSFLRLLLPDDIISRCYNPTWEYRTEYNSTYRTWTVLTNTGTSFVSSTFDFLSNTNTDYKFLLQDINGDQLPDLVSKQYNKIYAYLNVNGKINTSSESATVTIDSDSHFITGGIGNGLYGNGRPSHILAIKDAVVTPITFSRNDARERMLTGVINSMGVITHYNYSNLTSGNNYWTTSLVVSSPLRKLYMDMNVVGSVYSYANNQNIQSVTYYYNDAVVDSQGGGFRGFSKITTYDNIKNTKEEQTFDPSRMGIPIKYDSPTISESYTYSVSIASNKITKVLLTNKSTTDKLHGNTISMSNMYDAYGSLTSETINYGGGISVTTKSTVSNFTGTTPYLLGRLNEQTIENVRGSDKSITKAVYSYGPKQQVISKKSYNGSNLFAEMTYSYDANGYLSETKSKAFASTTWLTTKYTNDIYGRVTNEVNPMGFSKITAYNSKGEIASVKDFKGLETKLTYDAWGRTTSKTMPDGSKVSESMAWLTSDGLYQITTTEQGKPITKTNFDLLGREVRKIEVRVDGKESKVDIQYDNKGRISKQSQAYKGSAPTGWNTYSYDDYDRILVFTSASGNKATNSYGKNTVTSVVDGVSTTSNFNSLGEKISITDPSGTITHQYRADGQLLSTTAIGVKISFEYDGYGRQTAIIDPSSGRKTITYDEYGNVNKETDARGKSTTKVYDQFGRIKEFNADGIKSTYVYNSNGLLTSITESSGVSKIYTYHATYYDRIEKEKEVVQDGKWIEKSYTYTNGQIGSISYKSSDSPSTNFAVENYVYANGHLKEIKLGNTSVWRIDSENDLGQPTQVTTGGLTRTYGFTANGLPTSRVTKKGSTVIQNFSYAFDANKGNLTWRKDNVRNIQENFGYDSMNRLTTYGGKTVKYDAKGNILEISNIGSFNYNSAKPYAVESFNPIGTSQIPMRVQEISYNSLMRVASIKENGYATNFSYNNAGNRTKMLRKKDNKDELTRYYLDEGRYEIDKGTSGTKEKLYIGADVNTASVVLIKEGTGGWNIHYICRDYLGSITHITDANGTLKQELSYDAWGRLRNPVNHSIYASGSEPKLLLDRGYTGHEHLAEYGLINMNARLYDPVLCRFLSPDPYIQNTDLSQNYNRYAYAMNNPFRYTDPNGEFFFVPILIAAAIGAAIAGAVYTISVALSPGGFKNWDWGQLGKSMAVGFVAGAVGGAFAVIAPAFSATGTSFMANLPTYAGKAGWAALSGVVSAGSGMFVGDILDDGKINTKGISYLKGMGIAGLTAGLVSFASSMYDYARWDRHSLSKRFDILKKQNKDLNLVHSNDINGFAAYDTGTSNTVYVSDKGLKESRSFMKSAIRHERTHVEDVLNMKNSGNPFSPYSYDQWNTTESNAFSNQLKYAHRDGVTPRDYFRFQEMAANYRFGNYLTLNLTGVQYTKPNLFVYLRNIY